MALKGEGIKRMQNYGNWEIINPPLGEGGQSKVYLARTPARAAERAKCLEKIRSAIDRDDRAELATSISTYSREDHTSELGALKIYKIAPEGEQLSPPPGSDDYEAIERLKNEIAALAQNRSGLPKLLESNIPDRWILSIFLSVASNTSRPGIEETCHVVSRPSDP